MELKKYEDCIADCDKAIELEPTFIKSYYRKAKALFKQAKGDAALETGSLGLQYEPNNEHLRALVMQIAREVNSKKEEENKADWGSTVPREKSDKKEEAKEADVINRKEELKDEE